MVAVAPDQRGSIALPPLFKIQVIIIGLLAQAPAVKGFIDRWQRVDWKSWHHAAD
jgi:hypothetical protein